MHIGPKWQTRRLVLCACAMTTVSWNITNYIRSVKMCVYLFVITESPHLPAPVLIIWSWRLSSPALSHSHPNHSITQSVLAVKLILPQPSTLHYAAVWNKWDEKIGIVYFWLIICFNIEWNDLIKRFVISPLAFLHLFRLRKPFFVIRHDLVIFTKAIDTATGWSHFPFLAFLSHVLKFSLKYHRMCCHWITTQRPLSCLQSWPPLTSHNCSPSRHSLPAPALTSSDFNISPSLGHYVTEFNYIITTGSYTSEHFPRLLISA